MCLFATDPVQNVSGLLKTSKYPKRDPTWGYELRCLQLITLRNSYLLSPPKGSVGYQVVDCRVTVGSGF